MQDNVLIRAKDTVSFENSAAFSRTNLGSIGNGGNIDIQTGVLLLTSNSRLDASTRGRGNAGNIVLRAQNTVSLNSSNAGTGVEGGIGKGGNIDIQTQNLSITDGARLIASTLGRGDAGNVVIQADSVSISGSSDPNRPSTIRTAVDGGVGKGGDIQITTGTLRIADGANIGSGNTSGLGNAGNVMIQARDSVSLVNAIAFSGVQGGIGIGGNIDIQTGSLFLTQGSQLLSGIDKGLGIAGNVTIRARDVVSLSESSAALATLGSGSLGRAGNVNIQTGSLFLDNAQLASGTAGFGDAGNVVIRANDTVSLNGTNATIFSNIAPGGIGTGGNIDIQTGSLFLSNRASLTSGTSGIGDAGNVVIGARNTIALDGESQIRSFVSPTAFGNGGDIQIATGTLQLTNGAVIGTVTAGLGDAGSITIQARDAVSLDGVNTGIATTTAAFGKGGDITLAAGSLALNNGAILTAGTFGFGDSGNILIQTRGEVVLEGGSKIFSGVTGLRDFLALTPSIDNTLLNVLPANASSAGDIRISARSTRLDRGSLIATFATSGNGGNIQLNLRELLVLRRNSTITSQAGALSADGIGLPGEGGNITINARFVVAAPLENSDIIANAFSGSGGRLTINAQGIYWFTPRTRADLQRLLGTTNPLLLDPQRLSTNDITSFSQSNPNIANQVFINTPGIDPSRGLQQLPVSLVDPSNRIDQKCAAGSGFRRSSFTVTGRGGLPENPLEPLQSSEGVTSWVEVGAGEQRRNGTDNTPHSAHRTSHSETPSPLIEADSLVVGKDDSIQLVASQQMVESGSSWYLPTCASLK